MLKQSKSELRVDISNLIGQDGIKTIVLDRIIDYVYEKMQKVYDVAYLVGYEAGHTVHG